MYLSLTCEKKRELERYSLCTGKVRVFIIEVEYSRLPCCLDRSGSQNEIKLQWLRAFWHLDQQSRLQGDARVVRNDELQGKRARLDISIERNLNHDRIQVSAWTEGGQRTENLKGDIPCLALAIRSPHPTQFPCTPHLESSPFLRSVWSTF